MIPPEGGRILVVEDEGILAQDLELRLSRLGYEVVGSAARGEDALRQAAEARPDLALMDIRLRGGLDGVDTACRLASELEVPVVFLTAYADPGTLERAKAARPLGYLVKPFDDLALRTTLGIALVKARAEADLRRVHRELDARVADRTRELAEANRELRRLARIVDSSEDAIFSKDLDGTVRTWNPGAVRMYGYRPEEIVGRSVRILVPAGMEEDLSHILDRVRAGEPLVHYETRRRRKDGRILDVQLTVSPLKEEDGTVVGASTIARDITDRKRTAAELARSNADLERFVEVAAHDFKEPLRTIATHVQLLERRYGDRLDGDAGDLLRAAVESSRRLHDLMDALRAYSEAARRRQTGPISAEEVLRLVLRELEGPLADSGSEVRHGPLPEVWGDPRHLRAVFRNLLVRSLRQAGARPATVEVQARGVEGFVRFDVADAQDPLRPEHLDRIFRLFQRMSADEEPAIGLGLAVSRKIVESYGGAMWAEVGPARGSVIHFTWPESEPGRGAA